MLPFICEYIYIISKVKLHKYTSKIFDPILLQPVLIRTYLYYFLMFLVLSFANTSTCAYFFPHFISKNFTLPFHPFFSTKTIDIEMLLLSILSNSFMLLHCVNKMCLITLSPCTGELFTITVWIDISMS